MKKFILTLTLMCSGFAMASGFSFLEAFEKFFAARPYLTPAQSLSSELPNSNRKTEANARITDELEKMLNIVSAGSVPSGLSAIHSDFAKTDAMLNFEETDAGSLMVSRDYILIRKNKISFANPENVLLGLVAEYKRSPKSDDTFYYYTGSLNLPAAQVTEASAGNATYASQYQFPFALKKCRQIFGWRCNTTVYEAIRLPDSSNALTLMVSLYDLSKNKDNPQFTDGRRKNVAQGKTEAVVITGNNDWFVVYSMSLQFADSPVSFQSQIRKAYLEDHQAMKENFRSRLNLTNKDIP